MRLDPAYLRSVQRRVAARLDHRGDPCADIIRRMSPEYDADRLWI